MPRPLHAPCDKHDCGHDSGDETNQSNEEIDELNGAAVAVDVGVRVSGRAQHGEEREQHRRQAPGASERNRAWSTLPLRRHVGKCRAVGLGHAGVLAVDPGRVLPGDPAVDRVELEAGDLDGLRLTPRPAVVAAKAAVPPRVLVDRRHVAQTEPTQTVRLAAPELTLAVQRPRSRRAAPLTCRTKARPRPRKTPSGGRAPPPRSIAMRPRTSCSRCHIHHDKTLIIAHAQRGPALQLGRNNEQS